MRVVTAGGYLLLTTEDCESGGWVHKAGLPPCPSDAVVLGLLFLPWHRHIATLPTAEAMERVARISGVASRFELPEVLVQELESFVGAVVS